jgi:hypothetical protein
MKITKKNPEFQIISTDQINKTKRVLPLNRYNQLEVSRTVSHFYEVHSGLTGIHSFKMKDSRQAGMTEI